ncbi:MAG: EAL domain-containing protein [Gammaproteobacteria bacterium]|nr:EAL domain-containing protein [Gammaproteobacteria bacterium]
MFRGKNEVHPVLIIEKSATLQHAVRRLLRARGHAVTTARTYEEGLLRLKDRSAVSQYAAVIIGHPVDSNRQANELLTRLRLPDCKDLPVLVLAHVTDQTMIEWTTRRPRTALLLWDDYADCADCLSRLLNASLKRESPDAETQHIRVLFVDDARTVRASYKRLMTRHGYEVETASSAEEAMTRAKQQPFDIAIVDYFMPGGNGDILCRQLREHPLTADVAVAIITGSYLEEVIRDSLEAGAVECMFKNEANALFLARLAAMSRAVRVRKRMASEHQRLAGILSSVGDGVYGVNRGGQITFINPAARNILGYGDQDHLIGRSAHELFHHTHEDRTANSPEDCLLQQAYSNGNELRAWSTAFWHKSGMPIPVECTVYPLQIEGRLEGSVVAFRDVTERRILERELLWQANHDPLTKLYNRSCFEKQLESEVGRLKRSEEVSALIYLDLDRFKYINDTAGHAAGDRLLMEISQQLQSRIRDSDMLARLGGDEFAILMHNVDRERVFATAESFREILDQYTFMYGGRNYKINGSVGVALLDRSTPSPGDALANADIACHIAKGKGRNQTHLYCAENDQKVAMNLELGWSARLQDALRDDNFVLHYQPILALAGLNSGEVADKTGNLWRQMSRISPHASPHYEVLVRLVNSRGEIVYPGAFLPTAERFGLMHQIDTWVLTHAVKKLSELNQLGGGATFTINISGHSLDAENLVPVLRTLLEKYQLAAGSLVFEITEASAIANIDAAKKLINELRGFGCRFALDDFGSGFSSFFHLKHLPVDFVKIDGQFVQGMGTNPADRAIVASINDIAHSFGKRTVAEFVESADVLKMLQESGVDYVQGYYISPPSSDLPTADLQRLDAIGHA